MIHLPLTSDRLCLRPFAPTDWRDVHRYAADPDVVRYLDWGPNSEEQTRLFVASAITQAGVSPRVDFELAVTRRHTGALIGGAGIHVSSVPHREGWIGYCLDRSCWGQGLGTEVARTLVRFGFDQLALHRIFALCDPENMASRHVLEQAGMRLEGHLRAHHWTRTGWRDSLLYAVLEGEA